MACFETCFGVVRKLHRFVSLTVFSGICLAMTVNLNAVAEDPPTEPSEETAEAVEFNFVGERLVVAIPDAWQNVLTLETGTAWYADFIPPGQSVDDWRTQLSFETFSLENMENDPEDILMAEADEDTDRCEFVNHFSIFIGYENGYETAVRLFLCGENVFVNKGEVKLIKVIRGSRLLHAISLTERMEPFEPGEQQFSEALMADWSQYMNRIILCDGTEEHPCPVESPAESPKENLEESPAGVQ